MTLRREHGTLHQVARFFRRRLAVVCILPLLTFAFRAHSADAPERADASAGAAKAADTARVAPPTRGALPGITSVGPSTAPTGAVGSTTSTTTTTTAAALPSVDANGVPLTAFTPNGVSPAQAAANAAADQANNNAMGMAVLQALSSAMAPPPSASASPKPNTTRTSSLFNQTDTVTDTPASNTNSTSSVASSCSATSAAASQCQCGGSGFASLTQAVFTAQKYEQMHQSAIGTSQKLAINDYRNRTGCMYIVDLSSGQCEYATTSDWGSGSNKNGGNPVPNCTSGSEGTPAGFHLTVPHGGSGEKYNASDSLGLEDLQGQGTIDRGVLIHQSNSNCSAGPSTWGCAGVGDFAEVQKRLGYHSLVYNYFGEGVVGNCTGAADLNNSRPNSGSRTTKNRNAQ